MLDVSSEHLAVIRAILQVHAAGVRVRAFGSRLTGTSRPYSDLDLALEGGSPLSLTDLEKLRDAFAQSDLPYKVDVVDTAACAGSFRKIIDSKFEIIQ